MRTFTVTTEGENRLGLRELCQRYVCRGGWRNGCSCSGGRFQVRRKSLRDKWSGAELNRRHMDFQSIALPTELPDLKSLVSMPYDDPGHLELTDFDRILTSEQIAR